MRASLYLVFLLSCVYQLTAGHATSEVNLPVDERVFTGSKVYSLLQQHFLPGKAGDPPNDGSYIDYLRKILPTNDRLQFDLATIEFVAQAHNGHTFFWDSWLDESNGQPLGFYGMPLDGKWVIRTSFLNNLKPGDVISEIDNTTVEAFFLQQRRYISGANKSAERRNLFLLPYLFPEQFTLKLEDGHRVVVNRTELAKPKERTEGRWMKPGKVAYIQIPAFFDPALETMALDAVRQFHKAETLIIDVRNNAGGIPPRRLIRALMDRSYRGWIASSVADPAVIRATNSARKDGEAGSGGPDALRIQRDSSDSSNKPNTNQLDKVVAPDPNAFPGQVIMLVDGGCVSACEDFAEPFKESGRGILVGETTQGSSGRPFVYDFHNGMSLRIAVERYYFPDGSEFEGVGIRPDVEMHMTIEDLKNGRDPVLEKAFELAGKP
jgi:carboxyl-terminal processing protease